MKRNSVAAIFVMVAVAIAGSAAAASPSLHEVYLAAESGNLKQAEAMMDQVLKEHPNSAKAHFVEAELLAKQGRTAMAKAELATAERLAPGLPFAKPESVRELKTRVTPPSVATPAAVAETPRPADEFPWGYLLAGGLVLAAFIFFLRSLMRPRLANAPAGYGAGGQSFGAPGVGPMGPAGGPMGMGTAAAPGGGLGSGMLGGLATGVAVGAGVVAGEALMHRVLDGGHRSDVAQPLQQPLQSFDTSSNLADDNMGGSDFGIADGGSWDDGGGSAGGDDWN
jgi:hypothetical protein